jgi:hypothetical protein
MMKNIGVLVVFILSSVFVYGQQEMEVELEAFNKVKIFGSVEVQAKQGEEGHIKFISNKIPLSDIDFSVEDSTLSIKLTAKLFKDEKIYAELVYPGLEEVTLNASAEMEIAGIIVQPAFNATVSSGSELQFKCDVDYVELNAYQGAHIMTKGQAKEVVAFANTGGIISATELVTQKADVKFNTGGKGELTVEEELKARVTMGSHFSYFGRPDKLDVKSSLGGNISAWDAEEQK